MSSSLIRVCLFLLASAVLFAQGSGSTRSSGPDLDFLYFKERVQPIFLQKRLGHARCVECHTHRAPPLQPLAEGAETWNDEQSRQNFEVWKLFVTPGRPMESRALLHPLAVAAGGDHFHGGGKHWKSQADPEWQAYLPKIRPLIVTQETRIHKCAPFFVERLKKMLAAVR